VVGLVKVCRHCGRAKPAEQFLAGKAKRPSSSCSTCRRKRAADHRKAYYAKLPPDKRHELTHKKRAAEYGVEHEKYSRTEIMRRWGYRCAYCDKRATHMDHVHPLSKGGADKASNMLPACAGCNLSKGAKTLAEWAETFGPEV
jgi:5-methylcytosine-specific restriction endonuclease McrA